MWVFTRMRVTRIKDHLKQYTATLLAPNLRCSSPIHYFILWLQKPKPLQFFTQQLTGLWYNTQIHMSRKGLPQMKLEIKQGSEHSNKPRCDNQIVPKAGSSIRYFSKSHLQHGELKNSTDVLLDIITSWATSCQSNTWSCPTDLSKLL